MNKKTIILKVLYEGLMLPYKQKTVKRIPIIELLTVNNESPSIDDLEDVLQENWENTSIEYIDIDGYKTDGILSDLIEKYFLYNNDFYYLLPENVFWPVTVIAYKFLIIQNTVTKQQITSEHSNFETLFYQWLGHNTIKIYGTDFNSNIYDATTELEGVTTIFLYKDQFHVFDGEKIYPYSGSN